MDKSTVTEQDLYRKERELAEFEDDHYRQLKRLEAAQEELHQRHRDLSRLVDEQTEQLHAFLDRFSLSLDEARDFFDDMSDVLWEAEHVHRQEQDKLEIEREDKVVAFRKKRDLMEEDYYQLRKVYYASTNT